MKNKLYRASITLPNGKRKWIRSVSQEGLEQKKQELLTQIGAGLDVSDNSTFGEYAALWLRVYKVPYLRQNSLLAIENVLNNHIYPYLRDVPLKKVNQIQIQLVIASVSKMSKSLNNKVVQVLRGIFNAAVDNNLIAKSPVPATLRIGGKTTQEEIPLTAEQSQRLLDATRGTRAYLFCLLALQTGMRRGELCGLMWSDVDFPAGVIHVRHNALLTNAQTTVSDTLKTSAAVRDIPIPPTLFAELVKERKGAKGLYVLHMENGKPLSKSSLKCLLQMIENRTVDDPADLWTTAPHSKVVRTLDFHVHPHRLRHTYITRLFESGLDIKEIQYLAGHATVNMTLRVYTHYQHESRQQSTAQKVCAAFG